MTQKFDAVAMGPGLGTSEGSRELVEAVLFLYEGPIVTDADALNIVALYPETAGTPSPRRVWTPHPGEFQRLTGEKPVGDADRIAACGRFVRRFGGVVVLKGHRTVVVEDDRAYVNETGNPGMATGGAGDVLTGMIASLLGQGFAPFDAARLGVHLHGSAGDLAVARVGEVSLIASDIVDHIPAAILKHQQGLP
jgi:NAD(P)H-hydrate epimerase